MQVPEPLIKLLRKWGPKGWSETKTFFSTAPGTIDERLSGALSDIMSGKDTRIVAENIGSILRDELRLKKEMPAENFYELGEEIVCSLLNVFNCVHVLWNKNSVFLKDLEEVWITCEPMLDLVKEKNGAYETLLGQLKKAKRVIYFQSKEAYFNDLCDLLSRDNIEHKMIEKLHLVPLEQRYHMPLALYIMPSKTIGLIGSHHPKLRKLADGSYSFSEGLSPSWSNYMGSKIANNYKAKLLEEMDKKGFKK